MVIQLRKYIANAAIAVLIIITLILSGSAVGNIFAITTPLQFVSLAIFAFPFGLRLIRDRSRNVLIVLCFFAMFAIAVVGNSSNLGYVLTVAMNMIIAYSIVRTIDNRTFMKYFLVIMAVMSCLSVICWLLLNFSSVSLPYSFKDSSNGNSYGVLYFFNYLIYQPMRNCGMFWEPGLMSTFTVLSLIIDKLYFNSPSKLRTCIFIIASATICPLPVLFY